MKRRMIITNSLIVFCSLFIMLVISVLILMVSNNQTTERQAYNYLNVATTIYNGTNAEDTLRTLELMDPNVRVTIISLEGDVIIDSSVDKIEESHLNRWEIKNLGQICKRYSDTLSKSMLYIAKIDDGVYIRISIPVDSIQVATTAFLGIGTFVLLLIVFASIFFISHFNKKTLEPIHQSIVDLARLSDEDADIEVLSIDDLPKVLEIVRCALDDKIKQISYQKQQSQDVINYMTTGLVAVSSKGIIQMINEAALNIFKVKHDSVVRKEFIYLIRDLGLQQKLEEALQYKEDRIYRLSIESDVYDVTIKHIKSSWLSNGILLMLQNTTKQVDLERTKRDFFANASHELKSPLTCIIGYQQLITEGIETDPKAIEIYSKKTLKEARRMNDIVVDMLNLAKLECKEQPIKEEINLMELVNEITEALGNKIKEKEIKLSLNLSDVVIYAERTEIDYMIRNIIDNAIKYNNIQGEINICLTNEFLSIKDTGIGISEQNQKRVFERFYRVDKAKSKKDGGTGLGLAIVKHICELYKYKLVLNSKISEGTEFIIYWNTQD